MKYYNSKFNFCFLAEEGVVIYNTATGACSLLPEADPNQISELFCKEKIFFEENFFDPDTLEDFLKSGFLVEEHRNELEEIRSRYWKARDETPVVLTITTTMDCNLGCYYCYESRSKHKLEFKEIPQIINQLELIFNQTSKKSLHVD